MAALRDPSRGRKPTAATGSRVGTGTSKPGAAVARGGAKKAGAKAPTKRAPKVQYESDEAFKQRLLSEGLPWSQIQRAVVSGDGPPRREIKPAKRARVAPIQASSEQAMINEANRQSRAGTASRSTVNQSAGRAKPATGGSTGGRPLVRGPGGSVSLRGGSRQRRDRLGRFA